MEFRHIRSSLVSFLLFVAVLCIFPLWSCGGGKSPSKNSASGTGALSFNVVYHDDAGGNLKLQAASIDCTGQGIATLEAKVYNSDKASLADGGPWNCEEGHGTITAVPAGIGRTVVILGRNAEENIVFHGQKSGIDVIADSENNAGVIACYPFATSLSAPADASEVAAGDVAFQWEDVGGASEYHVIVWENSDPSKPLIDAITTATNYTPSGISQGQTYCWQVFAVDSYKNTGVGSQIWSFTLHANTSPVAQISIPAKGSTYIVDDEIEFNGSADDSEDSALSGAALVWDSDVYGRIGTGETFTTSPSAFSVGTHTITLTATDSQGATGTDTVVITVATGRLPDTGQARGQLINYEEVPGEDMTYTINPPSYTKLDSGGNVLDDNATEWAMVRDNVTGLIWEVKTTDANSIHCKDNKYGWDDAQHVFIYELRKARFGNFADWRLPTLKELAAIVHRGKIFPPIHEDYFPNTQTGGYWSATTYANNADGAWIVDFIYGSDNYGSKSDSYYVRAVRGVQ